MIVIILGLIVFFLSLAMNKMDQPFPRYAGALRGGGIGRARCLC